MTLGMVSTLLVVLVTYSELDIHMEGTKKVVKAMNKVVQGKVKEEGKVWYYNFVISVRLQFIWIASCFFFQSAVVKCTFTTA